MSKNTLEDQPAYKAIEEQLSKFSTWSNFTDEDMKAEFRREAVDVMYSDENLLQAWLWFRLGYYAAKRLKRK